MPGETGSYLYVAAEGQFEVCKAGRVLGNLGVGKVFGELAILYNCKRTASIRAVVDSKVWALERRVFQQVMVSSGLRRMVHQVATPHWSIRGLRFRCPTIIIVWKPSLCHKDTGKARNAPLVVLTYVFMMSATS